MSIPDGGCVAGVGYGNNDWLFIRIREFNDVFKRMLLGQVFTKVSPDFINVFTKNFTVRPGEVYIFKNTLTA